MDDDKGRIWPQNGHLMLIPERVFSAGLLGRPAPGCSGAFLRLCRAE